MLCQNYSSQLLGLEEVIVKNIAETNEAKEIYIELPRKTHKCPVCGNMTNKVHDYRSQRVNDIDSYGARTVLVLRKRRYSCAECGKRFYEDIPFLPRYHRSTNRLVAKIIHDFRSLVPASEIAKKNHVSVTTAVRYFDMVSYSAKKLPAVLAVDEFKGNAGGIKFQTIVTDPKEHKVIDVLKSRKSVDLTSYFLKFDNRKEVKYVVMDMSGGFFEIMKSCFPSATIVIDKFHIARQANWALEKVRKNVQKDLSKRYRKYFKRSKYALLKNPNNLSDSQKERLALMFQISPKLARAYLFKNKFFEFIHSPDFDTAKSTLKEWVDMVEAELEQFPEFGDCLRAVHNWDRYILNAFSSGLSNGFTEGCNNKTKVLKRVCFGMRNFKRFRSRIIHCNS